MRFGIAFANTGPLIEPDAATEVMRIVEDVGFDSVWTVEHVLVPAGYESEYPYSRSGRMPGPENSPIPDPLIWLTHVAAITESLLLGTGILILGQRNPAIVAKQIATLDRLSGGRLRVGVGAGWLQEEFDALGVPFEGRGRRLDAAIRAIRALWSGEPVTLDDGFNQWNDVISQPTPAGETVPIIIGGHTEIAARRAGRLGDGFFPGRGTPAELAQLISVMRKAAEEADRDPDVIEITASHPGVGGSDPIGAVQEMAALGVSRMIIPPLAYDADSAREVYGAFAENVIEPAQHIGSARRWGRRCGNTRNAGPAGQGERRSGGRGWFTLLEGSAGLPTEGRAWCVDVGERVDARKDADVDRRGLLAADTDVSWGSLLTNARERPRREITTRARDRDGEALAWSERLGERRDPHRHRFPFVGRHVLRVFLRVGPIDEQIGRGVLIDGSVAGPQETGRDRPLCSVGVDE